jgi:hypothetical protein
VEEFMKKKSALEATHSCGKCGNHVGKLDAVCGTCCNQLRPESRISFSALKTCLLLNGKFQKSDHGKYCGECFKELLPSEYVCPVCKSSDIVPRHPIELQPEVDYSLDICIKHPPAIP